MNKIPEQLAKEMAEWRHRLHQHPEFQFDLPVTSKFVADKLREWGIEVHENIGQVGVVGVLRKGDWEGKKTVALRADMDCIDLQETGDVPYKSCVPGKMHGCGHDGHTSSLLGAAKYLATEGNFNGTVHFLFQPDEEHGLGAMAMINDGLFERFPTDEVYGYHNVPGFEAGSIHMCSGGVMASENLFTIKLIGEGGHASSPHRLIDPVVALSQVINGLQTIVSRTINPMETVVCSVTEILTDGARNVVPTEIIIKGDYRTYTTENTDLVEKRMNEIVRGACETHNLQGDVHVSREFVVCYNSEEQTEAAAKAAIALVGEDKVDTNGEKKSFSEDFGFFAEKVSGCYVFIGNGTEGANGYFLHNPNYDYNDNILPVAAGFFCQVVEQQLS
ncbi:M20 aminoacylase family protein [Vibrio sp. NTOU-M3]|uniref:M20 aminoacylase family protein n=1 Tax=Vibrio sp. NTOU-M3 TaxID=3234954 RepID=UPI00349F909E